jgi:hypothetical protein
MKPKSVIEPVAEFFQLRKNIEGAFLRLAELLKKIRDEKLYEGVHENFEGFLMEAKLSKATASKLIQVHEQFVLKYEIPANILSKVGWSTLYEIQKSLPPEPEREDVLSWVEKGSILSREDTQRELKNIDGSQDSCRHSDSYTLRICNGCGLRTRQY